MRASVASFRTSLGNPLSSGSAGGTAGVGGGVGGGGGWGGGRLGGNKGSFGDDAVAHVRQVHSFASVPGMPLIGLFYLDTGSLLPRY